VRINVAVAGALTHLLAAGFQVLHAVGPKNATQLEESQGYRPLAFISRMDLAYAAADLAVCRSGAMTCAELAAVGLPAIYVPYSVGNGEQRLNASPVVAAGGGMIIKDAELTAASLAVAAGPLLTDSAKLRAMGERAASYGIRDAAARLTAMTARASAFG
jgi:UDP-N-acetylglucosamine--N-acetylmuramyl-(pentapeptide) pyrophosphoryl-undecaprenol N-acetylglucosamine transferase